MENVGCSHARERFARNFSRLNNGPRLDSSRSGPNSAQEALAERIFLRRLFSGQRIIQNYPVPNTKATFLIVFSPDGTKLACTNGNHNVYLVSVTTKKILKTLSGHGRTPWTLAFHPTDNNILASGCLDGEVRVWNLEEDSCEVWQSPGKTVIASLTFHPRVKLLVIATYRDLYFYDWGSSTMLGSRSTENEEEKIRYVKFDSSGDKLITAIALQNGTISQSDAVTYREVYQFTRERDVLVHFQRIHKFLKTQIVEMRSSETDVDLNVLKPTIDDYTTPHLCANHYSSFQNFVNVDIFCPTEFSMKMMTMLRSNTIPANDFLENCTLCRYTWLYEAVFKCRISYDQVRHICDEYSSKTTEKHAWIFTESRKRELLAENEDETNGLTENTLRYCFEHYARTIIAPYFAKTIPNSVSNKCLAVDDPPSYPFDETPSHFRRAYSHSTTLRSDCFLNLCQTYDFVPKGTFAPFLTSFTEVYHFLPSLREISTERDSQNLNIIMANWEHLYCKMLLVCNVIEGDNEFLLRKIPRRPEIPIAGTYSNYFMFRGPSTSNRLNRRTISPSKLSLTRGYKIQSLVSQNKSQADNLNECSLCKARSTESDIFRTSSSMKTLQKVLDTMKVLITNRYNARGQYRRIKEKYTCQTDQIVNSVGAAHVRTVETTKKCLLTYLSTTIRELKILLKANYVLAPITHRNFREHFSQMLIYITKRTVLFCDSLLDFTSNYDYYIPEITKMYNMEFLHINSSFAPSRSPNGQRVRFSLHQDDSPVFDEEFKTVPLDFSDDELSFSTLGEKYNEPILIDKRTREVRESGVVCSETHITDHLHSFDVVRPQNWRPLARHLDAHNLLLLQNVNALFEYFSHQANGVNNRTGYICHPLHRLQAWDFSKLEIPNISSRVENIIVTECKVHNDATIAISPDNTRIAALLSPNQFCQPDWLGVFSLEWQTLGHILYAVSLNQIAVSLSFSPTNDHLAVGYSYVYREDVKMADVIAVKRETHAWRNLTTLARPLPIITSIIDEPNLDRCNITTTVNCIKWVPGAGQGLVLGNSAGEIKFIY